MSQGTPKFLEDAINNALCIGPLKDTVPKLRNHIADFLSQKFGAEILNHPEHEELLMELFHKCTERKFKEPVKTIEEWKKE